jgi:HK97 family phage prohead protease
VLRRSASAASSPLIGGHGAVFNVLSEDLGGFRERIQPGAFKRTLQQGADVRALLNHDPNFVLGRTRSGTLRLLEDKLGLAYEVTPPDTQWARDLMVSMRRGDISQSSFQFRAIKDRWSQENGTLVRDVLEAQLFDVSVVTFPAYLAADSQPLRQADQVALASGVGSAQRGRSLTTLRARLEIQAK